METPKYRILKECPGLPVGGVLESGGGLFYSTIVSKADEPFEYGKVRIHKSVVESNPDYFQLIEVPEFTRSDMVEYALWAAGPIIRSNVRPGMVGDMPKIESWLESKAKQEAFSSGQKITI